MNITMFNRTYTIRRFSGTTYYQGYATNTHSDFSVNIHVHPSTKQVMPNPEGARMVERLDGHGMVKLNTADQQSGTKGDLLLYDSRWYECTNCQWYEHTVLSHYNYSFTLVPDDSAGTIDV